MTEIFVNIAIIADEGKGVTVFKFLGRRSGSSDLFTPRMPMVAVPRDLEEVFQKARRNAAGELQPEGMNPQDRFLIVLTPGRMIMHHPCPVAGTMPAAQVEAIEKMLPSKIKRNIAAIAYTGLEAVRTSIAKTIPFAGFLVAFAYIGHAVLVFEGHHSALAVGCRDVDLLLVDGAWSPTSSRTGSRSHRQRCATRRSTFTTAQHTR